LFFLSSLNFLYVFVFISLRFFVAYFCIYMYRRLIYGKVSKHWFISQNTEIFHLALLYQFCPSLFLIFKLEILWYCSHSLKKIKACGVLDVKSGSNFMGFFVFFLL
jgi:hypothetical protein